MPGSRPPAPLVFLLALSALAAGCASGGGSAPPGPGTSSTAADVPATSTTTTAPGTPISVPDGTATTSTTPPGSSATTPTTPPGSSITTSTTPPGSSATTSTTPPDGTTTTTTSTAPTTTVGEPRWRTVFRSGFGPGVEVVRIDEARGDLRGGDGTAPGLDDWETDLEHGGVVGDFRVYLEDGGLDPGLFDLVADPADPGNRVLAMHLDSPNVTDGDKGRVQAVLRDLPGLHEFAYEVRVRLEEGFAPLTRHEGRITWLTLAEFWNDLPGTDRGFRVTLNVTKEQAAPGTPLTWHLHGQEQIGRAWYDDPAHGWSHVATGVPVPLGEWVTLRVRLREGDGDTGLVQVEMTDAGGRTWTIADVRGRTRHPDSPADGFDALNPMKLYTSGQLLRGLDGVGRDLVVLWDDFVLRVPR